METKKNWLLIILMLALCSFNLSAQVFDNSIDKGAAVLYFNGIPSTVPDTTNTAYESELAINTLTNEVYLYNRDLMSWFTASGITKSYSAPSGNPGTREKLHLNLTDGVLKKWDGSAWVELGTGSWDDLTDVPTGFADGTDDWGSQVVVSDNSLTGTGVTGDVLSVDETQLAATFATDTELSASDTADGDKDDTNELQNWSNLPGIPANIDEDSTDDFSGSWNDLSDIPADFGGGADNLGNHTATQDLEMGGFSLTNNGDERINIGTETVIYHSDNTSSRTIFTENINAANAPTLSLGYLGEDLTLFQQPISQGTAGGVGLNTDNTSAFKPNQNSGLILFNSRQGQNPIDFRTYDSTDSTDHIAFSILPRGGLEMDKTDKNIFTDLTLKSEYALNIIVPNSIGEGTGIAFGGDNEDTRRGAVIAFQNNNGSGRYQGSLKFYNKQNTSTNLPPELALNLHHSGNVGIGELESPAEKLEVDGNIKVNGNSFLDGEVTSGNLKIDDDLLAIDGTGDGIFLEYQGTKLSVGELNTQSKSADATGLVNVGGFTDDTELLRIRSNDNTGYFQVIQAAASNVIMNIVQAGANVFRISEEGNTVISGEIQCGADGAANLNNRATITQAGKTKALAVYMGGDSSNAIEFSSESKNYFSASTTNSAKKVELGHYDATNPVEVIANFNTKIHGTITEAIQAATNKTGNLLATTGTITVERENAFLVAEDSGTNTHIHIELEATTEATAQSNIIILQGSMNGENLDTKQLITFSNAAVNSIVWGSSTIPASFTVTQYESAAGKPVLRLSITGGTLEDTVIPISVRIGNQFNGVSEICPKISRVVINTGTNL
jgi:hypothetical protein